ncbi:hypothetical protein BC941DRAFT_456066 [Chlamydoabsidia padenii]|nr:hypothetical protein BC941DRAFT_456066 [Chlamydoabsidia padenii]
MQSTDTYHLIENRSGHYGRCGTRLTADGQSDNWANVRHSTYVVTIQNTIQPITYISCSLVVLLMLISTSSTYSVYKGQHRSVTIGWWAYYIVTTFYIISICRVDQYCFIQFTREQSTTFKLSHSTTTTLNDINNDDEFHVIDLNKYMQCRGLNIGLEWEYG